MLVRSDLNQAGKFGRRIQLIVNMKEIKCTKNFTGNVIQYSVKIEPNKPKYLYRHIFKEACQQLFENRQLAYDGRGIAYSSVELFKGEFVSFIK